MIVSRNTRLLPQKDVSWTVAVYNIFAKNDQLIIDYNSYDSKIQKSISKIHAAVDSSTSPLDSRSQLNKDLSV